MFSKETLERFQKEPVAERLRLIELILQSVKKDIAAAPSKKQGAGKAFRVREFDFGQDISVDRDTIYAERGL